ncbi:MAG: FecR domain-containing protein [Pyrinomonadaceae bacterium]|nr:FecR domain-containing protein [Pyrinomonadaceae bacterium]
MISKTWSRKTIAAFLSVAVLSVYSMIALASPEAKVPSGELSISGQVTVNGQSVISGGTMFSDSAIVTSENSSATVNISKLGRVQLAPNSSLTLSFTDKAITGQLDSGIASISTQAGISVNLTTKDGAVVVDGSQATSFTVNAKRGITMVSTQAGLAELRAGGGVKQIAAGESGTAGTPNSPADDEDRGLSSGALAVLLIAAGGAVLAAILATREDDINFGGTVVVISPSR